VDADSDKWMQYATQSRFPFSAIYRRESCSLRAYEQRVCKKSACVVVTTEREAQLVRQISAIAHVHVVPNGVDTSHFDPVLVPREDAPLPTVVFVGDMSYFPNVEAVVFFAREILPIIHRSMPNVRFLIVGRNPARSVQQLRQIHGVEVTGFVPDVRVYLAKAQVAVAPFTIAAGIQNKILEAMAYGLPVVATPRTAQGLSASVVDMVETGNTPEELASKILLLLRDFPLARARGMESRRRVEDHYRWDRAMDCLLQLLESPASAELPRIEVF
jgi:sugar transferase (PEP-CTERM/EpsH1 system associated)